jgi:hypothetical protein
MLIGGISTKQARVLRSITALEDKYIFELSAQEAAEVIEKYEAAK